MLIPFARLSLFSRFQSGEHWSVNLFLYASCLEIVFSLSLPASFLVLNANTTSSTINRTTNIILFCICQFLDYVKETGEWFGRFSNWYSEKKLQFQNTAILIYLKVSIDINYNVSAISCSTAHLQYLSFSMPQYILFMHKCLKPVFNFLFGFDYICIIEKILKKLVACGLDKCNN